MFNDPLITMYNILVIGLDFSIRNAGISYCNFFNTQQISLEYIAKNVQYKNIKLQFRNQIDLLYEVKYVYDTLFKDLIKQYNNPYIHVFMENYSYGSIGMTSDIAEITSQLKTVILDNNIHLTLLSPSTVKKIALKGKKTSDKKEAIKNEVIKDFPSLDINTIDDNITDSLYMLIAGVLYEYPHNFIDLNKFNLDNKYLYTLQSLPNYYKESIIKNKNDYRRLCERNKTMIKQTRKEHKNNKHNKNRKHNKRLKYPSIVAEFDPLRI